MVVVWRLNGVRYDAIFTSRRAIVRGIIVPIGIGAVLLAAATTWLGWWHTVLFEGSRSGPAWALVVPVMLGAAAVTGARQIDYTSPKARTLPLLAIAVVIVGFAEEVATRGLLIVGPRDAGWSAVAVFVLSTGLFALLYGVNALVGQSARLSLVQVGVSFLAGAAALRSANEHGLLAGVHRPPCALGLRDGRDPADRRAAEGVNRDPRIWKLRDRGCRPLVRRPLTAQGPRRMPPPPPVAAITDPGRDSGSGRIGPSSRAASSNSPARWRSPRLMSAYSFHARSSPSSVPWLA